MTRVAVVTGAARGIGAATVLAFAARGWHVLAVDAVTDDPAVPYPLASKADLARVAVGGVRSVVADVRDPGALEAAVAEAESAWGGVDVAVAAAGVIAGGVPMWEVPAERQQAVLDVDLGGVLNLARAAVPALLRRPEPRDGRFIAVASAAAVKGLPMLAAYSASKAGVTGFIRALAVELAPLGITANAVSPGSTRTDILEESARLYGVTTEVFAAQQPLGRLLEPDEVAALIGWLASPQARGATGGDHPLDGGMTAL